jgi:holo-[acyl-carrier protein] synthase
MLLGLGYDTLDVARVKRDLSRHARGFKERVFTAGEISYCEAKRYPARHFAARFAAKEAFLKALGTGLSGGIRWQDIRIENDPGGRPRMLLSGRARTRADRLGVRRIFLSLSHTSTLASATVILESPSTHTRDSRKGQG